MYNSGMNTLLKTRFAPSPTGLMHFGNLRTALFNYLYAMRHKGQLLLRIEDTDLSRSETHYTDSILADLKGLGIEWQEGPYYQSERQAIYDNYYEILEKKASVYPCFCTEAQLALTRKVQLASGQPPRYPGTCRQLSVEAILSKKAANIPFTLRFEVSNEQKVEFQDLIKGEQRFDTSHIGDFIIRRNDGSASFMFCNAIDDALMGVTHALRGDDHLTNTPRQILILQALALPIPQYGHFPTILGLDSRPLSKRNGSRSIQALREEGFHPLAILNYLARLGHHDTDMGLLSLETLCEHFDLSHISSAPAHYDPAQLNYWQKLAMHQSTVAECWQQFSPWVKDWVPEDKINAFVEAIQPNIVMPMEALAWAQALFGEKRVLSDDLLKVIQEAGVPFFNTAIQLLDDPTLTFSEWMKNLQHSTGCKGKSLFFPLRAALTGALHGPELIRILDLLGIENAKSRLAEAAQYAQTL